MITPTALMGSYPGTTAQIPPAWGAFPMLPVSSSEQVLPCRCQGPDLAFGTDARIDDEEEGQTQPWRMAHLERGVVAWGRLF